jgi:hypothetical protein
MQWAFLIVGILMAVGGLGKYSEAKSRFERAVDKSPLSLYGSVSGFSSRASYWNERPGARVGIAVSILGLLLIVAAVVMWLV